MSAKMNKNASALILVAALFAAGSALAQNKPAAAPAAGQAQKEATPEDIFGRWDKDKNKVLSMSEFKAGWQELQTAMAVRRLHENFVAMDANKNGSLDATEYANLELVKRAGKSAPPMSTYDTDKNQALDFKEYVGMIKAMVKPGQ